MFPNTITIQWHLTEICNYRCKHCYQDNYSDSGGDLNSLLGHYKNIEKFVLQIKDVQKNVKAHINFTGGEPFMKSELFDLLKVVNKKGIFSYGILSNGFLLSKEELFQLKALSPKFIQISLEGNESMNDSIRGNGSYKQILKAVKTYNDLKIPVLISFTANSLNYKFFPEVVKVARNLNVYKVWTDRYLPINEEDGLALSTDQVKDFFQIIREVQKPVVFNFFTKTIVSASRALQFLTSGGKPYSCSAGLSLLAILPNGDVLPCRRLPIKVGNLNTDDLMEIYQNSSVLNDLRSCENVNTECISCYYKKSCNGGLRCLSYAKFGDYNRKEPNCWI